METAASATHREPWNKGKIVGQKAPFMTFANGRFGVAPAKLTLVATCGRKPNVRIVE